MSKVERLSKAALQKILSGNVTEDTTCFVKFYSNTCPMCHNLRNSYIDIAEEYLTATKEREQNKLRFFAFNIDDYPEAERVLNFQGVPTVVMIKTSKKRPRILTLADPPKPNQDTWYNLGDIKTFIEKEI
tara:strand:- start:192 stop:581 length:390 start_codon:yes stop_codon:yes gene_type:complete